MNHFDLDFGSDDAHVGDGHEGGAGGILDAGNGGLILSHGQICRDAVEGGERLCEREGVRICPQG